MVVPEGGRTDGRPRETLVPDGLAFPRIGMVLPSHMRFTACVASTSAAAAHATAREQRRSSVSLSRDEDEGC